MENYQEENGGDPLLKAGLGPWNAKSEAAAEELGHMSKGWGVPAPPAKAAQQDSRWAWVRRLKAFPEGARQGMVGCQDPSPAPHTITVSFLSRDPEASWAELQCPQMEPWDDFTRGPCVTRACLSETSSGAGVSGTVRAWSPVSPLVL